MFHVEQILRFKYAAGFLQACSTWNIAPKPLHSGPAPPGFAQIETCVFHRYPQRHPSGGALGKDGPTSPWRRTYVRYSELSETGFPQVVRVLHNCKLYLQI